MDAPPLTLLRDERECHGCGLFQRLPPLAPGDAAACRRCGTVLRHGRQNSLNHALACAAAGLLLYTLALQLPYLHLSSVGRQFDATLFTGPRRFDREGMWELSFVVLLTLVAMPGINLTLLLTVLLGLRSKDPPNWLPRLFGLFERLRPWAMIEIFLLGVFVSFNRLRALASVEIGSGLIALAGVMLCSVAADVELDQKSVWERMEARGLVPDEAEEWAEIEGRHRRIGCDTCRLVLRAPEGVPCPRCGWRLRRRKPDSLRRCWAFMAAAAVFYIPANVYPIMTVTRLGRSDTPTILGGVVELVQADLWPLAVLVFLASITVPVLKIAGLTTMLVMTQRGSEHRLRDRTRLYKLIDGIGRWSMIDVFAVTVLVALVHVGQIASVTPRLGAIAFAAVVILTMFAAASFDPRLMWDAAAAAGHDLDTEGVTVHGRQERLA